MNTIEIKNFELNYDGMYFIKWDNQNIRVFLELHPILKMLKTEGISNKEVIEPFQHGNQLNSAK